VDIKILELQSWAETLKEFVQVSSPFPFSMLFLTPKCFTLVNIEWGSGVFQGIVALVACPARNLETVCASKLPLFNVVFDTKVFYFGQH